MIERRFKLLSQGHINTLSLLLKFPPTEHEPKSFKLDSCLFSVELFYFFSFSYKFFKNKIDCFCKKKPHLISFSLSGVFREGKQTDKVRPMRSFYRVFACVPDANSQLVF